MQIDIPFHNLAELEAHAAQEGSSLTLRLSGTADMRVSDQFGSLLAAIHESAVRSGVKEVVVDLRRLEFMNSSSLKQFANWIGWLRGLTAEQQYDIRFISDPAILWQRKSLQALSCFAANHIRVENDP